MAARSKAWLYDRSFGRGYDFESRRWHGCLSLVNVVYCQVQVSVTGRSFVQRNLAECVCVKGRKEGRKKERKTERQTEMKKEGKKERKEGRKKCYSRTTGKEL